MIIRKATVEDAQAIRNLHMRSVRRLCSPDYAPEQIEAWVNHRTLADYQARLTRHQSYVAESEGHVVGYTRFNPGTNELCSVYVDPDWVRHGIGTRLVARACREAAAQGMVHFWLDSSLTAVPFYESVGFKRDRETMHAFSGVDLECVRMSRQFNLSSDRLTAQ